jgi:hypothetical protein
MAPSLPKNQAKQVRTLGETPAEARARMESSAGAVVEQPPRGQEVKGPLRPEHLAAIEQAEGGFKGGASDGPVEDYEEPVEPPTPSKAMETIRQLSQDKLQLQTERDSALNLVSRYKAKYGELD